MNGIFEIRFVTRLGSEKNFQVCFCYHFHRFLHGVRLARIEGLDMPVNLNMSPWKMRSNIGNCQLLAKQHMAHFLLIANFGHAPSTRVPRHKGFSCQLSPEMDRFLRYFIPTLSIFALERVIFAFLPYLVCGAPCVCLACVITHCRGYVYIMAIPRKKFRAIPQYYIFR